MFNNAIRKQKINDTTIIVSTMEIPKNTPIIEITGNLYKKDNKPQNADLYLQVSNQWFIGPSGGLDDVIRHSCNPNCYLRIVGKRAILYSIYNIRSGVELTFYYSTSSTESIGEWKMECHCGSYNCRKIISGFQHLDIKLQEEYKKKGMIPLFITNPMFIG